MLFTFYKEPYSNKNIFFSLLCPAPLSWNAMNTQVSKTSLFIMQYCTFIYVHMCIHNQHKTCFIFVPSVIYFLRRIISCTTENRNAISWYSSLVLGVLSAKTQNAMLVPLGGSMNSKLNDHWGSWKLSVTRDIPHHALLKGFVHKSHAFWRPACFIRPAWILINK